MNIQLDIEILNSDASGRELEVSEGTTYEKVLEILDINQETVLLLKEGQAVPLDGMAVSGNLTIMYIASQG
ncbi:MAG: sulfur carrier protein [Methanolobus sp. T82-4]|nr:MAG: sulfur carrier protein [Methanolobus sp. T82-4]